MGTAPQNADRPSGMAHVMNRNISALIERRKAERSRMALQERLADKITRFTGSMAFVYIHVLVFGFWILVNVGVIPGVPRFDPSLVILAMAASVEAIFLTTFVLITQNRMQVTADKRADLDLQISLLAEHEITRLITLVTAIAGKMDIEESRNPELSELAQDVRPEKVLDHIEKTENKLR